MSERILMFGQDRNGMLRSFPLEEGDDGKTRIPVSAVTEGVLDVKLTEVSPGVEVNTNANLKAFGGSEVILVSNPYCAGDVPVVAASQAAVLDIDGVCIKGATAPRLLVSDIDEEFAGGSIFNAGIFSKEVVVQISVLQATNVDISVSLESVISYASAISIELGKFDITAANTGDNFRFSFTDKPDTLKNKQVFGVVAIPRVIIAYNGLVQLKVHVSSQ